MDPIYIKILETVAVFLVFLVAQNIAFKIIDRTRNKRFLQKSRGKVLKRVINIISTSLSLIFILIIWGVKQADLAVFMGSVLTVVGVAFFAQWSILSNITSSIILFFNHPIRLNDSIMILEAKDYQIEGKVVHIGLFFITLKTSEDEEITLPNNIFISKSIKKVGEGSSPEEVEDEKSE